MRSLRKKLIRYFGRGKISTVDGIDIWFQSFGDKKNPTILLIMGGGCQGVLWPNDFCEKLSCLGLHAIRFDLRDTGFSSYFDYQKQPYNLLDMAKDVVLLLNDLNLSEVYVMGTSMGGAIAQLLAAYYPKKVKALILMATTADWRNIACAISGEKKELPLSYPTPECLDWIGSFYKNHQTLSSFQKIKSQLLGWKILNGPEVPFDTIHYMKLLLKTILRQRSYSNLLNHVFAIEACDDLVFSSLDKLRVPSLVIHGTKDPIFPLDHGMFLHKNLKGDLLVIEKMGHNLNSCFYDTILDKIRVFLGEMG